MQGPMENKQFSCKNILMKFPNDKYFELVAFIFIRSWKKSYPFFFLLQSNINLSVSIFEIQIFQ